MAGFNLADLFELVVDAVPDRLVVIAGERRFTYADLDRRANQLAHRLAAAGVGAGDSVGLQLVNGPEYLEGMLACFKLRAVPININYRYVDAELRHLYDDAGLVALVHHRQFAPTVGARPRGHGRAAADPRGRRRQPRPRTSPWALTTRPSSRPARPTGRPSSARATTSTASTPAAPPAPRRACCGATRTSSSPPWEAATPSRCGDVIHDARGAAGLATRSSSASLPCPCRRSCTPAPTGSPSPPSSAAAPSSCCPTATSTPP